MANEFTKAALYGIKTFNKKVKEKIGMQKLIELLNEYENRDLELEEGEESNARTENNGHLWFNGANKVQFDTYMFDNLALSKRYGFIKWLVENDKIDLVKVYENLTNYEIEIRIRAVKELLDNNEEDTIAYLKLLMLLAIQDEPIEFLISILK